jgi:hypothetical protein
MPQSKWLLLATITLVVTANPAWASDSSPPAPGPFAVLPAPAGLAGDPPVPTGGDAAGTKLAVDLPSQPQPPVADAAPVGCVSESDGLFLSAEYLLLKPQRRDLDFAILNATQNGSTNGSIESLTLPTVSAFRVGAGYRLGDGWDLGGSYSYLFSRGQSAIAAGPTGTLYATLTSPQAVEQASTAVGDIRLNYNVADFEIGRDFALSDRFRLRLFGGAQAAFINQHLSATYNGRDANNAGIYSRVDFDGGGLRVGAEGVLQLGRGFGLYARAAGSLLEGRFEVNQSETNGTATLVNVSDKFEKVVPVSEYALGVSWERNNIRFRLGYEMVNWTNLVDRPDFVSDVNRGKITQQISDLSLSGLSVQIGFGY